MSVKGIKDILMQGRDILWTGLQGPFKILMAQIGDAASNVPGELVEIWQHIGFVSRPPKPKANGNNLQCAQGITFNAGNYPIVFATRDARYNEILGNLGDGETCIYASGENGEAQGRILIKKNGSLNLFTTEGNAAGGVGMGMFINPDGSITLTTPSGNALILDNDGVKLFNGDGAIQIGADGQLKFTSAAKIGMAASAITLGGPGALPAAIGPQTVACIATLQSEVNALKAELTIMAAAWAALGALTGPILGAMLVPVAAPVVGAEVTALAAVVAGAASVASTSATIPAMIVSVQ